MVAAGFGVSVAQAQGYPDHPIRLIVGTAPGGTQDGTARMVSKEVEAMLGQPIVVDNRGGANGIIGYDLVAKSAPDGYTLLHTAVAFAINATVYKKLPFDVSKDFMPVTTIAVGQGALIVVHSSVPAHSVKELVELAKQKQLTYSSPGIGNGMHLITEAFDARAGVKMLHVPYKGGGPTLNDLLAGQIPAFTTAVNQLLRSELGLVTDREYQVLRLIGSGQIISDIARDLGLSVKTVSTYRARVLEKLGLTNNSELTVYAIRNGLV